MQTGVNYQAIEIERAGELQRSLTERLQEKKDAGAPDSLRKSVLSAVAAGHYDGAKDLLESYIAEKANFPNFQKRAEPFLSHSLDLIRAIETKRSFSGLGSLALTKQQELYDRVINHFEELKHFLKKIEFLEKEARLDDIRSTTWVVRAIMNSLFLIIVLGFAMELKSGLSQSFLMVFETMTNQLADRFFQILGI